MRTSLALTSLLAYCASAVYATALTYRLEANEKACFFTNVEQKGTKVAFYFAVRGGPLLALLSCASCSECLARTRWRRRLTGRVFRSNLAAHSMSIIP